MSSYRVAGVYECLHIFDRVGGVYECLHIFDRVAGVYECLHIFDRVGGVYECLHIFDRVAGVYECLHIFDRVAGVYECLHIFDRVAGVYECLHIELLVYMNVSLLQTLHLSLLSSHDRVLVDFCSWRENLPADMGQTNDGHHSHQQPLHQQQVQHSRSQGHVLFLFLF